MGTVSVPEVKRPGRGVNHPRTSNADVKQKSGRVPLLPLCAFMACDGVNFAPFLALCLIYGMESKSENSVSTEEGCIFMTTFNSSRSHVRTNPPSITSSATFYRGHTKLVSATRSNCETDSPLYSSEPVIDTALKNHIHKILPTFFLV